MTPGVCIEQSLNFERTFHLNNLNESPLIYLGQSIRDSINTMQWLANDTVTCLSCAHKVYHTVENIFHVNWYLVFLRLYPSQVISPEYRNSSRGQLTRAWAPKTHTSYLCRLPGEGPWGAWRSVAIETAIYPTSKSVQRWVLQQCCTQTLTVERAVDIVSFSLNLVS